jgi:hypothetical protein
MSQPKSQQIYLYVHISTEAALTAGRSVAGGIDVPLTDEWVAARTPEQLAIVSEFGGRGPCDDRYDRRLGSNLSHGCATWTGASLIEPTLGAAKIAIDALVAYRAAIAREVAAKEEERQRELDDLAAALAVGPDDDLVHEQYDGRFCRHPDVCSVRDRAPELVARAEQIAEKRTAAGVAERTAQNAEREAKKKEAAVAKKATIDAWIAAHGSESQRQRYAERLLPKEELWSGIRAQLFAALGSLRRYNRLQAPDVNHGEDCYGNCEISYSADAVDELDAVGYERLQQIRALVAGVELEFTIRPRIHRAWPACESEDTDDLTIVRHSALISIEFAGQTLSREYALD